MADRPLASSPRAVSQYARDMLAAHQVDTRFGVKVVRVTPTSVDLDGGESAPADLIVWASGVKAQTLASPFEGLRVVQNGRLAVDTKLRVLRTGGDAIESFYAIGDCAAAPLEAGGVVPATAQTRASAGWPPGPISCTPDARAPRFGFPLSLQGDARIAGWRGRRSATCPVQPGAASCACPGSEPNWPTPDCTRPISASCSASGAPRPSPSATRSAAPLNPRSNSTGELPEPLARLRTYDLQIRRTLAGTQISAFPKPRAGPIWRNSPTSNREDAQMEAAG